MQLFAVNFILLQDHSTCLGCCPHPSSGVHKTVTTASGTGHFIIAATFFQRGQRVGHIGPGTHRTGGWVGLRAGLDRCGKSRPPPAFDPQTIQPIASRYTDYTTRPTAFDIFMVKN